jgi:hypothetical protein
VCVLFCFPSAYLFSSSHRPFLNHVPFAAVTSALIVEWGPWAAERSLGLVWIFLASYVTRRFLTVVHNKPPLNCILSHTVGY